MHKERAGMDARIHALQASRDTAGPDRMQNNIIGKAIRSTIQLLLLAVGLSRPRQTGP